MTWRAFPLWCLLLVWVWQAEVLTERLVRLGEIDARGREVQQRRSDLRSLGDQALSWWRLLQSPTPAAGAGSADASWTLAQAAGTMPPPVGTPGCQHWLCDVSQNTFLHDSMLHGATWALQHFAR